MDIPHEAKKLIITYQVKMMPFEFYEDFRTILQKKCAQEDRKPTIVDRALVKMHLTKQKLLPEGYRYNMP